MADHVPAERNRLSETAADDARKSLTVPNHTMKRATAEEAARVASYPGELDAPADVTTWVNARKNHPTYRIEYRVVALQALLSWAEQLKELQESAE